MAAEPPGTRAIWVLAAESVLYRLFLLDGTSLVSYGETRGESDFALLGGRVTEALAGVGWGWGVR